MMGIDDAIAGVSDLLKTGIDKIWPSPTEKATAEATIMQATASAAIDKLRASQAVMLAEAQSQDKWTSRARPSFLYVVYILLLASLPMGLLFASKMAAPVPSTLVTRPFASNAPLRFRSRK